MGKFCVVDGLSLTDLDGAAHEGLTRALKCRLYFHYPYPAIMQAEVNSRSRGFVCLSQCRIAHARAYILNSGNGLSAKSLHHFFFLSCFEM